MPSRSNLLLLLSSGITPIHADRHGPRYVNVYNSVQASSTFSLPVIVTAADPSISPGTSSATPTSSSISNSAVTHGNPQSPSYSAPVINKSSSVPSVHFSYAPGIESSSQSTTGFSSSLTISSNEPTIASTPPAGPEPGAPSATSILFSYAPNTSSQVTFPTISTPSPSATGSAVPIPRSTTFLTLYTTIYRSANSGAATTAGDHPLPSSAAHGAASGLAMDSTTTMTIFTTVYASASGSQSSTSDTASTSVATSLGIETSLASVGVQPPATPDVSPSSKEFSSSIAFTYAPGSTFVTSTKPHTSSSTSEEISSVKFSYAPGSTSSSSSAPSDSEPPTHSYTATRAPSASTELSPSIVPPTPGGITIIPVDPNATTITITKTDAGATQTVTETVAQITVTVNA
ncbi:hypothetical protein CERZMDRAFT_83732 [Cercospora zeae-maydis SCOH1-5]|uniref:REJ domain-containing protein n=1 Tax=Cercospora zeae-maydis SCOH1-5 TaxID=717836 RepID=A0A6A6FJI0_9PEZI|nr:hypothetical protein CERZMDRAFT_83732 [Cercospora zeae-maydis SCOH1-5]